MKTSTEIASAARIIGEERAIEAIAKAGFDAWDFSMFDTMRYDRVAQKAIINDHPFCKADYLSYARRLKRIGLDNGIVCNQSHAPFPIYSTEIRSYLKRAIECTAEAGGDICVIHPDNYKGPEENAEIYAELLPFARECGVRIATENMWCWNKELDCVSFAACMTPESFCAHIDLLKDDYMVACLDVGHAEMRGTGTSCVELIHALGGKRLKALHIHDNDKWHDSHRIPFSMNIDFPPIVKALKDIEYDGYFTLEAEQHLKEYTPENVAVGIGELAASVRRLTDMWDAL